MRLRRTDQAGRRSQEIRSRVVNDSVQSLDARPTGQNENKSSEISRHVVVVGRKPRLVRTNDKFQRGRKRKAFTECQQKRVVSVKLTGGNDQRHAGDEFRPTVDHVGRFICSLIVSLFVVTQQRDARDANVTK